LMVMQSQRSGAIVNVSSIWGHRGVERGALYTASKHAIIGLTRAAALEAVKYSVRVNAIGPGYVDTAMLSRVAGSDEGRSAIEATIPQARAGTADEVAEAIIFLAGEGASYLTGHTLFVDGGVSAG
jgi:NAD(P)-dependent dehydrogenase (short-subunit alcohol dehydrogenase family)